MKKTIYKYIFSEFIRYFTITLFALSAIVWTVQAVNFLDLVTEDGHAFSIYFLYSILTISKVFTKLIPFVFLVASILTILKLEKDNELIVLWTSGLNKIFVVNHLFKISLIVMFFQLFLTIGINPSLLNLSRMVLKNSQLEFVSSMFKEKQFNDTVQGLTIFIDEKSENKIYKNIFILDESSSLSSLGSKSSTIVAKSGYVSDDEKSLILLNGNIQKSDNDGGISVISFQKTSYNLSGFSTKSISEPKMQETTSINIYKCIMGKSVKMHNCNKTKKTLINIKIEINKRIGMPFFIPLIALICSFLLGSRKDKKNFISNKYISFLIGFIILALAEMIVRYSGTSWHHTAVYYLIPAVMIPLFYIILIRKFKYENLN